MAYNWSLIPQVKVRKLLSLFLFSDQYVRRDQEITSSEYPTALKALGLMLRKELSYLVLLSKPSRGKKDFILNLPYWMTLYVVSTDNMETAGTHQSRDLVNTSHSTRLNEAKTSLIPHL